MGANIEQLTQAAQVAVRLLRDYSGRQKTELSADPLLYGYFEGAFEKASRQHYIQMYGSSRPQRIDFRLGGVNPVVVEFALRPKKGGPQLYGSQNRSELRKLARVTQARARLRVLVLVDLFEGKGIHLKDLRPTYAKVNAGRGRFKRQSVRVIYAHRDHHYDFIWWPKGS